jgi:hypothetical protein
MNVSDRVASTTISGGWLVAARVAWVTLTVLTIWLFVVSIPTRYEYLLSVSSQASPRLGQLNADQAQALSDLGLSLRFYALYDMVLEVIPALVIVATALVMFWRRSDDWMALFVALALLTLGLVAPPILFTSATVQPTWRLPVAFVQSLGWACLIFLLYLFPDGLLVPRWTRWLAVVGASYGLWPLLFPAFSLPNDLRTVATTTDRIALAWFLICFAIGVTAQMYRYRYAANVVQRQQTKWVVFGFTGALIGSIAVAMPILIFPLLRQPGFASLLYGLIIIPVAVFSLLLMPLLSIAIAILRYRLFDIDLIINRVLVYGALTALLAVIYFGSVVLLKQVVGAVTGQAEQPPLVIIASTLASAALFQPLRRRIQALIDHHFYRRKYDAQQTLRTFSTRLREETDLARLSDDLLAVVQETMQPTHVSLWLQKPEVKR